MLTVSCLALLARLRWPDLAAANATLLQTRFQEVSLALTEDVLDEDQALRLTLAADVVLFVAFLHEWEPQFQHYPKTIASLRELGIAQGQVEAAAYIKVQALVHQQDPHFEIQRQIVERLPAIFRKLPGRPKSHATAPSSPTELKHLHLNAQIVELVQDRADNLTRVTEDGLILWLLLGETSEPTRTIQEAGEEA